MAVYCVALLLAVIASTAANEDIKVDCLRDSVNVTWTIPPDFKNYDRFFLGKCSYSDYSLSATGQYQVNFRYKYVDCGSLRRAKGKWVIYQNEMTYRPRSWNEPPDYTYTFECSSTRDQNKWLPKFARPGAGVAEGRGRLIFHMALLNDDLSAVSKTNEVPLGSMMPIWAAVEQKSHQPLLLLMDECVAMATPDLQPGAQYYPLVGNQGCLLASKWGNSKFLPRYHSSALILYLQTFKLAFAEELPQVYINCRLVAWDPSTPTQERKACNYVKELGGWELLDDAGRSDLCSCCDTSCDSRNKREASSGPQ